MKKLLCVFFITCTLLFCASVSALAISTSEALSSAQVQELLETNCPVALNPPDDKFSNTEYIDPFFGSLSLSEDILYLPGKNGLDLNLTLSYNSQETGKTFSKDTTSYLAIFNPTAYYYSYVKDNGATKNILIAFNSEYEMLQEAPVSFTAKRLPDVYEDENGDEYYSYSNFSTNSDDIVFTRNTSKSPVVLSLAASTKLITTEINAKNPEVGNIWTWNIPRVLSTIRPTKTKTVDGVQLYDLYTAMIDVDGNYIQAHFFYDIEDGEITDPAMNVLGLPSYDAWYDPENDFVDAERGITYRCKVRDAQGRIMYFSKPGNIVALEDRFGNIIKYTFENKRLTKIIDTLGRVVTITYIDNNAEIYLDIDGEGSTAPVLVAKLLYSCTNDSTLDPNNHLFADNLYTSTIVKPETNSSEQSKIFTYKKWENRYQASSISYRCEYELCDVIQNISYPNGLSTVYTYAPFATKSSVTKTDYHVVSRADCDGNTAFNEYTYTYDDLCTGLDPDASTIKTRSADNTKETYSGPGYLEEKILKSVGQTLTETYEYTTSRGRRKTKLTTQQYSGGVLREISTPYNKFRPSKIAYDDYEKSITYFGDSSFVETEVYKQSENVLIKTTYILSDEGEDFYHNRTIDKMIVAESTDDGDTYTEKYTVEYTYNPDGTLASEVLDPDGINKVTLYSYSYGTDGSITTTVTASNLKDADNLAIDNITTSTKVDYLGRLILSTDGNGNETTYEYDLLNRLVEVTNPDNTTITYEYDTQNRTTIMTDENGIMQKSLYDAFGNVLAVYKNVSTTSTPRWVAVAEYEYDALCRPVIVAEYTGYNTRSLPTKWTETHYTYGAFDNVSEIAIYDETGAEISKQTYTYNYADRMGATSSAIEAHDRVNGGVSRKFTSVTIETTPKDGITPPTVKQYLDRQGRLCKQIRTDGDNEYISTYTYDALGNMLECKDETAYAQYSVDYSQKYEYNYLNKPVKVYNAEGNFTESTYDIMGNLIAQTDYMGNATTYTYDSIGRQLTMSTPVDTDSSSLEKYYYDANSNITCVTKETASGNVSYPSTYDCRNRLISSFDGANYTVNEYDGNYLVKTASGLSEVMDISSLLPSDATYTVSAFTYDHMGNLESDIAFNGSTYYTYDVAGNVISSMDPNTDTTYNQYDSRGNLTSSTIEGDTISYTYNAFDLVTQATRNGISTTYAYDNLGRNISEVTGDNSILRTYNTAGQVKTMLLKQGTTTLQTNTYDYNILGNMTSASDGVDTILYEYNENGLPISEEKPGLVTTYTYTPGSLMKSTTHTRRRSNDPTYEEGYNDLRFVSSFEYSYYPDGNVQNVTDTRFNKIYNTSYIYDSANRLTAANITQNNEQVRAWAYSYNNRGDRISRTVVDENNASATTAYSYTNHRLTGETTNGSTTTYTYDVKGNTLSKTTGGVTTLYTYTPRNEVSSVTTNGTTCSYTYNASSLRTSKTANGVTTSFVWAGNNIIRESTPNKSTDYFYGVNRVSRTVKGDAYTYNATIDGYYDETTDEYIETVVPVNGYHEFYVYDGRGNIVHTMALDSVDLYLSPFYGAAAPFPEMDLNCDGEFDFIDLNTASMKYPIVQDYYYSPFGELWQGEKATDTNPFRYAGEYYDAETGNIYLRARYYNPSIGRFISLDPIKDGTNWYVYCGNNPVAFVDPSGLKEGDKFETADDAAIDFGKCYAQKSIEIDREYGAAIYKVVVYETKTAPRFEFELFGHKFSFGTKTITTDKVIESYYTYTKPKIGSSGSVSPSDTKDGEVVAQTHTHGAYTRYEVNAISEYDKDAVENRSERKGTTEDTYVITPWGDMFKGTYENKYVDAAKPFIYNGFYQDPNLPEHLGGQGGKTN